MQVCWCCVMDLAKKTKRMSSHGKSRRVINFEFSFFPSLTWVFSCFIFLFLPFIEKCLLQKAQTIDEKRRERESWTFIVLAETGKVWKVGNLLLLFREVKLKQWIEIRHSLSHKSFTSSLFTSIYRLRSTPLGLVSNQKASTNEKLNKTEEGNISRAGNSSRGNKSKRRKRKF